MFDEATLRALKAAAAIIARTPLKRISDPILRERADVCKELHGFCADADRLPKHPG